MYPSGPVDGITDVPGVRVANLTKIEGANIRTGATAILPNADPWNHKVSAAAQPFNGNGEMTGVQWVNESGYLETPIVLTDTLDVGRADDGVISWMMQRYAQIGLEDDVPLPVVAECDDQGMNDIRGRYVQADDVVALLSRAQGGQFARGNSGAGTGMRSFKFKAGIGSASRVLPAAQGGYTVGVLVNNNTSSAPRQFLRIGGYPIGERMRNELLPTPKRTSLEPETGRKNGGSIVIIVATNAPLESRQLAALTRRAELAMGRVGMPSPISSGDLLLAFSTTYTFDRDAQWNIHAPRGSFVEDETIVDALYVAAIEATESAIYDSLFSAQTMTSPYGTTYYALPAARVREIIAGMH
ncbi:MAG: P1 family peptidase [Candidatus Eremiobacteraeota bacterium]|nr:P1 family peptidase [Candidatus Eremiobacteraeota bacterium]